jgi:hypothetical protein
VIWVLIMSGYLGRVVHAMSSNSAGDSPPGVTFVSDEAKAPGRFHDFVFADNSQHTTTSDHYGLLDRLCDARGSG